MSVTAIHPVLFVNAPALVKIEERHLQSPPPENTQKAKAQILSDVSSSGSAVVAAQAFTAFPPAVQPIASLFPTNEMPQALPVDLGSNSSDSPAQWSGAIVDIYA